MGFAQTIGAGASPLEKCKKCGEPLMGWTTHPDDLKPVCIHCEE